MAGRSDSPNASSSNSAGNACPVDISCLEDANFDLVDEFMRCDNSAFDVWPVLDNMTLFDDHEMQNSDVNRDLSSLETVNFSVVDEFMSDNCVPDVLPVLDNMVLFEDHDMQVNGANHVLATFDDKSLENVNFDIVDDYLNDNCVPDVWPVLDHIDLFEEHDIQSGGNASHRMIVGEDTVDPEGVIADEIVANGMY